MEQKKQRNVRKRSLSSLTLKCSVLLILLLTSMLLIACSPTESGPTNLGVPPVTVTIQFNTDLTTAALPTQAPYQCGAWITNTSPGFVPGTTIPIYAHFIHLVNGNPQGVLGATAQATVHQANGIAVPLQATTTGPDGLAVFVYRFPNDITIANRNNLVTVTFTGTDGSQCTVDQGKAAYFTPLLVSPAAAATKPGRKKDH
jgi:Ca2+-binding RTX toxin-like protein